jgi:integrase
MDPVRPLTLIEAVREQTRVRHYSIRTEKTYVGWIRRYIRFCGGRHPRELGVDALTTFLTHLAVDLKVAAGTQNQALQALLFLYRDVLRMDLPMLDQVVRANKPRRLPVVLTHDEVRRVFAELRGRSRLVVGLLYGTLRDAARDYHRHPRPARSPSPPPSRCPTSATCPWPTRPAWPTLPGYSGRPQPRRL